MSYYKLIIMDSKSTEIYAKLQRDIRQTHREIQLLSPYSSAVRHLLHHSYTCELYRQIAEAVKS